MEHKTERTIVERGVRHTRERVLACAGELLDLTVRAKAYNCPYEVKVSKDAYAALIEVPVGGLTPQAETTRLEQVRFIELIAALGVQFGYEPSTSIAYRRFVLVLNRTMWDEQERVLIDAFARESTKGQNRIEVLLGGE